MIEVNKFAYFNTIYPCESAFSNTCRSKLVIGSNLRLKLTNNWDIRKLCLGRKIYLSHEVCVCVCFQSVKQLTRFFSSLIIRAVIRKVILLKFFIACKSRNHVIVSLSGVGYSVNLIKTLYDCSKHT